MGEHLLVPTRLIFEFTSRFSFINSELPNQKERVEAIKIAQSEMNAIVAEWSTRTALTHQILLATNRSYNVWKDVLDYFENRK